jgi:hypothetical protein
MDNSETLFLAGYLKTNEKYYILVFLPPCGSGDGILPPDAQSTLNDGFWEHTIDRIRETA